MATEQDIQQFLREEIYTTPKEKDPLKPFMLEDGFINPNPNYDSALAHEKKIERELKRRSEHLGTSFFLNFDPITDIHRIQGREGDDVRQQIADILIARFIDVFVSQCPQDNPPPINSLKKHLQVDLCENGPTNFNNGEIYFWLRELPLVEDFVFKMLRAFKESIDENPVIITYKGKEYEVPFYGWGFRYY
uniref:Uncharacterized protein n=1 Tax=candidate division CPR3 bacterium TaxID=2268181 RepID=A0A7C4R3K0_UNCC3